MVKLFLQKIHLFLELQKNKKNLEQLLRVAKNLQ